MENGAGLGVSLMSEFGLCLQKGVGRRDVRRVEHAPIHPSPSPHNTTHIPNRTVKGAVGNLGDAGAHQLDLVDVEGGLPHQRVDVHFDEEDGRHGVA